MCTDIWFAWVAESQFGLIALLLYLLGFEVVLYTVLESFPLGF